MRTMCLLGFAAVAFLGLAGPASGQNADDRETCARQPSRADPAEVKERRIEACRRVIASPAAGPADKSHAHVHIAETYRFYLRDKDPARALASLDEAVRLDPSNERAFSSRGHLRRNAGDLEGAIRDYDEALRLNPKDQFVLYMRAETYAELGRHDEAIRDYRAYLVATAGQKSMADDEFRRRAIEALKTISKRP